MVLVAALVSPALAGSMLAAATVLAQSGDDGLGTSPLLVLVGVVIGAGVGALIGMTKDRTGLGLLLGGFLGCIGWLIIALLPKKVPKY